MEEQTDILLDLYNEARRMAFEEIGQELIEKKDFDGLVRLKQLEVKDGKI